MLLAVCLGDCVGRRPTLGASYVVVDEVNAIEAICEDNVCCD